MLRCEKCHMRGGIQRNQAGRANTGSMTAFAYKGYGPVVDSIVVENGLVGMRRVEVTEGGECGPRVDLLKRKERTVAKAPGQSARDVIHTGGYLEGR